MRPLRRYVLEYRHPDDPEPVRLFALGETPCKARNAGFEMLEALLKVSPDRPRHTANRGWRLTVQDDQGIV